MNFKTKVIRTVTAAGLALTMTTGVAFASIGNATVTADSLRLRSQASTTSVTIAQAPKGSTVTVEEDAGNGWYKVTYNNKVGYMSADWLTVSLDDGTVIESPAVPLADEPEQQRGLVTADVLNVRSGPSTTSEKVGSLRVGNVVDIVSDPGNGWYEIESGYVSAEYITLVGADYESSSAVGAAAVAVAKSLLGCRYVSGGSGPNSFDCSGFTYYVYKQLGYSLPHGSSSQYYNSGYFVSTDAMQPGDLIFFFDRRFDSSGGRLPTTHVGMYVGNGQFIHASTTSYRVQYDSVSGYYAPYIVGAKRIG